MPLQLPPWSRRHLGRSTPSGRTAPGTSGRASRRLVSTEPRPGSTRARPAPGPPPAVVSQAPGELEVFWKATDGTLSTASFTGGAWSAPAPLATGVVTGNPDAVAASDGSVAVVWRDAAGYLWSDLGASYGWFGAQKVGLGGLATDPPAVVAGPSAIDAVWRTQAGSVWAAGLTSGGSPQVEVDKTVSVGRPVAAGYGSSSVTVVMQRPGGSLASAIYAPTQIGKAHV